MRLVLYIFIICHSFSYEHGYHNMKVIILCNSFVAYLLTTISSVYILTVYQIFTLKSLVYFHFVKQYDKKTMKGS